MILDSIGFYLRNPQAALSYSLSVFSGLAKTYDRVFKRISHNQSETLREHVKASVEAALKRIYTLEQLQKISPLSLDIHFFKSHIPS